MGGSESKPAPVVIEDEPPAGSGQSSMVYPDRPETPRLDGLTRSIANECSQCVLRVAPGVSSSSVKLSREFGEVSSSQCRRYTVDSGKVSKKEMSFSDFLGNLQAGNYWRDLGNGYCEQVNLNSDDEMRVRANPQEYNEGLLRSVRIQKMSSGSFSADTKAKLTPSIPFKLSFNGKDVTVKTMSVYHPCPLRIEGFQPDAVLSLNDPSFEDGSEYVILVPLVGRNTIGPSVSFFERVLPQLGSLTGPEPSTGQYITRDIPTGRDWALTKIFTTKAAEDGSMEVQNGYYEWKGMPALQRVANPITQDVFGRTITTGTRYSWVESGKPSPRYIMLDTPVPISTTDLSSITQSLPSTPSADAIHAILYSNNPLQRGIVHKQGVCNAQGEPTAGETPSQATETTEKKETFIDFGSIGGIDLQGYLNRSRNLPTEACDAWTAWAQYSEPPLGARVVGVLFTMLVVIAMAVGAYVALTAVLRLYDVEAAGLSSNIGKVAAVFFKSLQQKAQALKEKASLAISLGPGLASGKGDLSKLAGSDLEKLAANTGDLEKLAANSGELEKLASKSGDLEKLASNVGKVATK